MTRVDLLVRHAHVVTAEGEFDADILVHEGKILGLQEQGSASPAAEAVIDAAGMVVLPGAIDPHVHFSEPGRPEREGFVTGTAAAAAGGVTTIFDHPNTQPAVADADVFRAKRRLASEKAYVDFCLWGALLPDNIDALPSLHEEGAVAFKAFLTSVNPNYPMVSDHDLLRGLEQAAALGAIVGVHAESHSLISDFTAECRQRPPSWGAVTDSRPLVAEEEAVARVGTFARSTGANVHIVHVSATSVVDLARLITPAEQITVETCPHYLAFDESAHATLGAMVKIKPPLRPGQIDGLWAAVVDGRIDIVASDHAPYLAEEKPTDDVWGAAWGMPSLETMLPMVLSEGHMVRGIDLSTLVRVTSTNAARRFKLYPRKGTIQIGSDADLVIWDPAASWTVRSQDLKTRCGWSPWVGQTMKGRIRWTVAAGRVVFREGEIVGTPGQGRFVAPVHDPSV